MANVEIIHDITHYEEIVNNGLQNFLEVGRALVAIREGKLYRTTHETFAEYCKERWDISGSYAYRLINKSLTKDGDKQRDKNYRLKQKMKNVGADDSEIVGAIQNEADAVEPEQEVDTVATINQAVTEPEEEAGQIKEHQTGEPYVFPKTINTVEEVAERFSLDPEKLRNMGSALPDTTFDGTMPVEEFNEKFGVPDADHAELPEDVPQEAEEEIKASDSVPGSSDRLRADTLPDGLVDGFDERHAASNCDEAWEMYRVALIEAAATHESLMDCLGERFENVPAFESKGKDFMIAARAVSTSGLIDATEIMIERWIKAKKTVPEIVRWN